LISPYDQDRIFSGLAIEIRIWSKTCAGTVGLKRFIISWFIVFSSTGDRRSPPVVEICQIAERHPGFETLPLRHLDYSAASAAGS
jgi:hypothetical protein